MKRAVMSALLTGRMAFFLTSVTLFLLQTSSPKAAEDEDNSQSFASLLVRQCQSFKKYFIKKSWT